MSIRLEFSAFVLSDLKQQLESKDAQLADETIQAFEEGAGEIDLDAKAVDEGRVRIKNLIANGKKDSVETIAEVSAVNFLAANSSQAIEDDCEAEWPWSDLNNMNVQFQNRFDARTKELFNYCVEGRTLIGDKFDSDAGFYLYLTNAEVATLRAGLDKVHVVISEIVDSGAMNEQDFDGGLVDTLEAFMETLDAVSAEKLDLFAIAC
ncbi:MAG: hypothetical protein JST89_11325 [Cyanobacteria bacterium SZAS-4]|nr:hypothetical protein [Cyanobacteria bacterium SZAS-4]